MNTGIFILIIIGVVARLYPSRVATLIFLESWFTFFVYVVMKKVIGWDNLGITYHFLLSMKNLIILGLLYSLSKKYNILKFGYILAGVSQLSVFLSYHLFDYYTVFLSLYQQYTSTITIISSIQIFGLIGGSEYDRKHNAPRSIFGLWSEYIPFGRSFATSLS